MSVKIEIASPSADGSQLPVQRNNLFRFEEFYRTTMIGIKIISIFTLGIIKINLDRESLMSSVFE